MRTPERKRERELEIANLGGLLGLVLLVIVAVAVVISLIGLNIN